ncbi:MAG: CHAP domain-containing protein [Pseudolabrys sp.]
MAARTSGHRPGQSVTPVRQQQVSEQVSETTATSGGFSGNSLVSEARKYIGTNPTGRASQWCGAFMDLVLKNTGHKGGGNLAGAYARYGTRVSGPQVGAIAVMGGHVGLVTGIDANGNPIIISGNTWGRESGGRHTVLEHSYPRGRILAYVMP